MASISVISKQMYLEAGLEERWNEEKSGERVTMSRINVRQMRSLDDWET